MHLITNLHFLASSGNGERRGKHDGIYRRGNKDVYITFCHANNRGNMALQMNGFTRDTTPSELRSLIFKHLHVFIPNSARVFINPCQVERLKEKYGDALKENKIYIVSGKDAKCTWFLMGTVRGGISDKKKIDKNRKVHMLVIDQNLPSETVLDGDPYLCNQVFKRLTRQKSHGIIS